MSPGTLSAAHYVHEDDAAPLAAELTGLPSPEFSPADALEAIRKAAR